MGTYRGRFSLPRRGGLVPSLLGTLALMALLALMLLAAPAAKATLTAPAGDEFDVQNTGPTLFTEDNGNGQQISCTTSDADGSLQPAPYNNLDDGSVLARITDLTFGTCTSLGGLLGADVDVHDATEWSITAMAVDLPATDPEEVEHRWVNVNVPPEAVTITLLSGGVPICAFDVGVDGPPDGAGNPVAQSVYAEWANGTASPQVDSTMDVYGQIWFGSGCGLDSPAVFDGSYEVQSVDSFPTPITVDPSP